MGKNKLSKLKYTLAAAFLMLLITAMMVFIFFTQKTAYDPASEKILRQAAAKQLDKDPNDLTNEDFAKITELNITRKELYDIKLLEKFTNLKVLSLNYIPLPGPAIPKWMIVMAKLKIINLQRMYNKSYMKKYFIDLSPLENLFKLQIIYVVCSPVKDLLPLGKLKNIQEIHISHYELYDYGLIQKNKIKQNYIIGNKSFAMEQGNPLVEMSNIIEPSKDSNIPFPKIVYHPSQMIWASPLQWVEMNISHNVKEALK
ncbi:MAG: hypothetical protein JW787_13920 [Sedimentisphaerales bacterium]|nr:hypothetical protein [Sedimentisphaerales bacterium]